MMPINRPVRLVTKDGTVINGRRLNEDTYSIQSWTTASGSTRCGRRRARIHDREDFADAVLQGHAHLEELSDLLGYLLSLKGL